VVGRDTANVAVRSASFYKDASSSNTVNLQKVFGLTETGEHKMSQIARLKLKLKLSEKH
jgi:hypothetical protein